MKTGTSVVPRFRLGLDMTISGLAAGIISSLAISGLLLLVEKISGLPMGTFYVVLVSAVMHTYSYTAGTAILGFLMHLVAGTLMALAISAPLSVSKRLFKYAPAYGLGIGFVLWTAIFLPVTYWIVIPLLNSVDSQGAIRQQIPEGNVYAIAASGLLGIMDRVVVGSIAFNVFYGLLVLTLTKTMYDSYLRKHRLIA